MTGFLKTPDGLRTYGLDSTGMVFARQWYICESSEQHIAEKESELLLCEEVELTCDIIVMFGLRCLVRLPFAKKRKEASHAVLIERMLKLNAIHS
ncbi:hypothetical protein K461DRAFT_277733 [Myriangium duriaei CBS 260.36]|uniref:Uncharacterized protein n=1 Tax=Myriangium duriaei CBS 260.36 TaxID=1168546 RepID=A0A9P4MHA5_9PEZI|nr:hypothetical protein K461DRAFT_277733 [Myriangium duriaei CBS 260.36]